MSDGKEPARFGKYSKTIRGLQDALEYMEQFASQEIDKRDATSGSNADGTGREAVRPAKRTHRAKADELTDSQFRNRCLSIFHA